MFANSLFLLTYEIHLRSYCTSRATDAAADDDDCDDSPRANDWLRKSRLLLFCTVTVWDAIPYKFPFMETSRPLISHI